MPSPAQELGEAIVSRIKVLAGLDIAERRKPQDGKFQMKIGNKAIDFRISTLPTLFGEKIVIRILDSSSAKLGIDARVITPYHRCIKDKYADKVEHMFYFYAKLGWAPGPGRQSIAYQDLVDVRTGMLIIDAALGIAGAVLAWRARRAAARPRSSSQRRRSRSAEGAGIQWPRWLCRVTASKWETGSGWR